MEQYDNPRTLSNLDIGHGERPVVDHQYFLLEQSLVAEKETKPQIIVIGKTAVTPNIPNEQPIPLRKECHFLSIMNHLGSE